MTLFQNSRKCSRRRDHEFVIIALAIYNLRFTHVRHAFTHTRPHSRIDYLQKRQG